MEVTTFISAVALFGVTVWCLLHTIWREIDNAPQDGYPFEPGVDEIERMKRRTKWREINQSTK